MTCREAEELILDGIDSPLEPSERRTLNQHLTECDACRQFQQTQLALDVSLASHFAESAPAVEFGESLQQRIAAEKRRVLWEYVPDVLHLGGGLGASIVCAWMLPFSGGLVMAAGLGLTLVGYFFQALLRSAIEE